MSEKVFKRPEGAVASIKFIKAKDLADEGFVGTVLEGEYIEALKNNFDESKRDYKFKLDDGTSVIVNGTGSLSREMDRIEIGTYCQLNYKGQIKLQKGKFKGKPCHMFEVLIAE